MRKQKFSGKILIIGFGSIGQAYLPILLRHFDVAKKNITIVTGDNRGEKIAKKYGISFVIEPLKRGNYKKAILSRIGRGDFLLNLSVDVYSVDIIKLCQENGILYLDTVVESWKGYYIDKTFSVSERSNYNLREQALALRKLRLLGERPTAVIAHGANPGLVSHFVKEALLKIAKDTGKKVSIPKSREGWAKLAQTLGVKVIHIAERDTQKEKDPKNINEFLNTWSVDGLYSEGLQPSEMGWGTHEKRLPEFGREHKSGCKSAIYLEQPGFTTQVRSWTPVSGQQYGWVITHHESISISDYLTLKDKKRVLYRPTVHYAYHPCDSAVLSLLESAERGGKLPSTRRVIRDKIIKGGVDELGVLLMGHKKNALWYGSSLSIDRARKLAPYNNATSLQVVAGLLGAMSWIMQNPNRGILDAEEIDHKSVMKLARPYLGKMLAKYTDWTPLQGRGELFPEKLDTKDPWQFDNFLV